MPRTIDPGIAVIGIDIGKNSFTSSASTGEARSPCARSGHAGRSTRGSPTCRRASSVWKPVSGRII